MHPPRYNSLFVDLYDHIFGRILSQRKNSVTKRMGILKTVELADFAEKNARRIRILKTVGLADIPEKNAKRMGMEC